MALSRIQHVSYKLTCIAMAVVTLHAAYARADDADHADHADTPMFSFSGFGTLGVVHSSQDQADFTDSVWKPNGAGHRHDWSADVDSRLGLQIIANVTPKLSAVLQVVAEQNYDNSYRPHVEWANIKYAFTPDFDVRVGRIAMPTFLVGDYRKVGYAVP